MLKKEIKYVDFEGNKVTEVQYFNLMKTEIIDLDFGKGSGGLDEWIKRIVRTEDYQAMYNEFKDMVLMAYGQKTPDGRGFAKSEEARLAFSQTLAFDALIIELSTNDNAAADFIIGILPSDVAEEAKKQMALPPPNTQPAENLRNPSPEPTNTPPQLATSAEASSETQ